MRSLWRKSNIPSPPSSSSQIKDFLLLLVHPIRDCNKLFLILLRLFYGRWQKHFKDRVSSTRVFCSFFHSVHEKEWEDEARKEERKKRKRSTWKECSIFLLPVLNDKILSFGFEYKRKRRPCFDILTITIRNGWSSFLVGTRKHPKETKKREMKEMVVLSSRASSSLFLSCLRTGMKKERIMRFFRRCPPSLLLLLLLTPRPSVMLSFCAKKTPRGLINNVSQGSSSGLCDSGLLPYLCFVCVCVCVCVCEMLSALMIFFFPWWFLSVESWCCCSGDSAEQTI